MLRVRMLQILLVLLLSYCTNNAINSFKQQEPTAAEEATTTASHIVPVMIMHNVSNNTAVVNRITDREIRCIADMAYKEAVGENVDGWMAVIHVALNRMENGNFPSNACDVIYQRKGKICQYSWACERGARNIARESNEYRQIFLLVKTIASVENRSEIDPTKGSLYFKKYGYRSKWFSENLKFVTRIGNHQFFVEA